jgi:hypothetical protein
MPFDKAKDIKKLVNKALGPLSFRPDRELTPEEVAAAREYIAN